MEIINWLLLATNIILAIITGVYVFLTKRILDVSIRQSNLTSNPVIGITILSMGISEVFGNSRRNLGVELKLTNVGNGPALDVLVDAEIILKYSNINGENTIPARFEPGTVSFIKSGDDQTDHGIDPSFGNTFITYLFDDFRENSRLNLHRIEVNPSQEAFPPPILKIYVYYHNNVGQYFQSQYETHIDLEEIPDNDTKAKLSQIYIPRPKFHAELITKEKMDKDISERNSKRDLCGW